MFCMLQWWDSEPLADVLYAAMVRFREAKTPNHTEDVEVGFYMKAEGEKVLQWAAKHAPSKSNPSSGTLMMV